MTLCFVALGSNLDDPLGQVRDAILELAMLPATRLQAQSSLYRTQPIGPADQPDYVNAVVRLDTSLAPLALLDRLQALESTHGRVREGERWGARTLDLDLLLYADQVIEHPRLQVPHPRMDRRAFVLVPLAEIDPDLVLPDGRSVQALRHECLDDPAQAVRRID